ncbi:MAG: hypothetical protein ACRD4L_05800, partial [Pyrinomonadaceae bacterium]
AIDKTGNIKNFDAIPAGYAKLVRAALTTGEINITPVPAVHIGSIGSIRTSHGVISEKKRFDLLSPVGRVIKSDRPTFRWQAIPRTAGVTYKVFIADSVTNTQIESRPLTTTEWIPEQPLVQGRAYGWAVEATQKEKLFKSPIGDKSFASFSVLDKVQEDELKHGEIVGSNSHLLLGLLYAKAGLTDEAEREFKALQAANPDSRIVNRWIQSLRR